MFFQLGVIGLAGMAIMTTYCCHLIVKCKYYTIDYVCEKLRNMDVDLDNNEESDHVEHRKAYIEAARKKMETKLTYKDIGTILYGRAGTVIVGVCIIITQCGFCVGYHIFIGNVLLVIIESNSIAATPLNNSNISKLGNPGPIGYMTSASDHRDYQGLYEGVADVVPYNIDTEKAYAVLEDVISNSTVPGGSGDGWNSQVALIFLVLLPAPLFMVFTLFRKVRGIGPISVMASTVVGIGFIVTLIYIVIGKFQFLTYIQTHCVIYY